MKIGGLDLGLFAGRCTILAAIFGVWEYLAATKLINPLLFGQPSLIFSFLWDGVAVSGDLLKDLAWTMAGTLIAFSLGALAAIFVGMLFVSKPRVEEMLSPILTGLNAMPRIALAPLFLIWFGLGISSKVALGFSLTFFIVLSSTVAGGRGVSADHLVLARALGANGSQVFRLFTLPSAVPVIFNGLRLGLVYALLGVIGGEIIAAEHGLGQSLSLLASTFRTNGVFAVLFLLAGVGVGITWLMTVLERRLLRWQ
ncbi:ABC transporter permease [Bradyrhizobium denitrificans]